MTPTAQQIQEAWMISVQYRWAKAELPLLLQEVWNRLHRGYGDRSRGYHTWQHIDACLALVEMCEPALPRSAWAAIVFHDAVYDPTRHDNERQSADLARALLAETGQWSEAELNDIERWIGATASHQGNPNDPIEQAILAIDLAILGASDADFDAFEAGIRFEYNDIPEELYTEARGDILRRLVHRLPFPESWDAKRVQAIKNVQRWYGTPQAMWAA